MTSIYLLMKTSWADFDIEIENVLFAGPEDIISIYVDVLNNKRSEREIKDEIKYYMKKVKYKEY
jgi:hypothetical protein